MGRPSRRSKWGRIKIQEDHPPKHARQVRNFARTPFALNPARVPSNYHIEQGKRCERVDEKIVAKRGPPIQDNYYLTRVFAEIFAATCHAARPR